MSNLPAVYGNLPQVDETNMLHDEAKKGGALKVSLNHKENAGKFVFSDGTVLDKIEGVSLIAWRMSRSFWQGKGKPRICFSDNYYEPSPSVDNPVSASCQRCPAAVYGRETPEKNQLATRFDLNLQPSKMKGELCAECHDLLLMDKNRVPFIMQFKGTSKIALENKLKAQIKKAQGQKVPACCVEFDIVSEQRQSKGGDDYFAVDLDNFRLADDPSDNISAYNVYSQAAQNIVQNMHDEHATMDKEQTVNEVGVDPQDNIPF